MKIYRQLSFFHVSAIFFKILLTEMSKVMRTTPAVVCINCSLHRGASSAAPDADRTSP